MYPGQAGVWQQDRKDKLNQKKEMLSGRWLSKRLREIDRFEKESLKRMMKDKRKCKNRPMKKPQKQLVDAAYALRRAAKAYSDHLDKTQQGQDKKTLMLFFNLAYAIVGIEHLAGLEVDENIT
jgi:hypothetical protein